MSAFHIQEFAKLAGVTLRALHHYDGLGLLSPSHRTESGYRLYCHNDLDRWSGFLCSDTWDSRCGRSALC